MKSNSSAVREEGNAVVPQTREGVMMRAARNTVLRVALMLACGVGVWVADPLTARSESEAKAPKTEALPILSYDTDTGFGYGAKLFALNHLGFDESFDLVLFNSSKGERWYRLVSSLPDFEVRQGTVYPLAVDVAIDYDKWISNSFFGVGNQASFADREYYTREQVELGVTLSRGFSTEITGQVGLKFRAVRNSGFSPTSRLATLEPRLNASRISYFSMVTVWRLDTRNSYVNPSHGTVLQGEAEVIPQFVSRDVSFARLAGWLHRYSPIPIPKTILAVRFGIQGIVGNNLPVQALLPVGGNNTLRGSPQDRYLDKISAVGNVELRFPIYWRFGGILGFDAGKVWDDFSKMDFTRWATNPVSGLRFYMDTFVVRLDVGFGKETTGFFLNFGHIF